jgi:predicted CXXCH cytochrome family protein
VAGAGLIVLGYFKFGPNSEPDLTDEREPGNSTRTLPHDPRLTFQTPYRNVRPEVKYVGDDACAKCHREIVEKYRHHPMGQSLATQMSGLSLERFDEAAHNPFQFAGITYQVNRQADGVRHLESLVDIKGNALAEMSAPIAVTIGSGQNGRAFLVEREGSYVASPISWYPKKMRWDLSPGYEKRNPHFGRPITTDCLFCHANYAEHIPGTTNRYRSPTAELKPIGCERCHGPGELHVHRHRKDEIVAGSDDTIVNPARLEHTLRESVCQQCHLQGQQRVLLPGTQTFDFRPGLPLHLFAADFIKPPTGSSTAFVSSVEQMYTSQCFQKSKGSNKMGCISCHDPHSIPRPELKVSFYRDRCMNCHKDKGCSLPLADRLQRQKEDNCYACHMPPTGSNINHTTISDHCILRKPESPKANDRQLQSDYSLISFHQNALPVANRDMGRELGIALIQYADSLPSGEKLNSMIERALPLLNSALDRDKLDLPALEAKGNALWFLGRLNEAIEAYEDLLQAAPEREMTLYRAATLCLRLGRLDDAKSYAQRAIKINPWRWEYHQTLARVHGQTKDWKASLLSCQEALKLNTLEPGTNRQLVLCYLRIGEMAKAQKAFEVLLALIPSQNEELRQWFFQQKR